MQDLFSSDLADDGFSSTDTSTKPKKAGRKPKETRAAAEKRTAPKSPVVPQMGTYPEIAPVGADLSAIDPNGDKFYIYGQSWIVLQNRLLHAINNLTLNERRLILYLSPMVRTDVEQFPSKIERTFTVHAADFAEHFDMDKSNAYRVLSSTADSILTKAFWFWDFESNRKNPNRRGSSWVDNCVYRNDEGAIEIRLSSLVVEMLTVFDKQNPFTKYKKDWIVHLGRYGIDLFEIMISAAYRREQSVTHTLEYLREKFDCVDKYPQFSELKRNVLMPAIKDIQKSTPYSIEIVPIREGRTIKKICFNFSNNSTQADIPLIPEMGNQEDAIRLEFKGIRVAIPEAIQVKMLEQYNGDVNAIEYSIRAANEYIDNSISKGREISNIQGVYISALKDDWGKPLLEKEEAERQAKLEKQLRKQREKEEAERKKQEFERRYNAAYETFMALPDAIKPIVLDTIQSSLPKKQAEKFALMREVGVKQNVASKTLKNIPVEPDFKFYPFMSDEFKESFVAVMEGTYS